MEFPRPQYWSGETFPSPGDLPKPGIEPRSLALQADSLPAEPQGKPVSILYIYPSLLDVPLPPPPTPLGHHRALSRAPCAMQQLPTGHLFYPRSCIHVSATFSIRPTLPIPTVATCPFSMPLSFIVFNEEIRIVLLCLSLRSPHEMNLFRVERCLTR